MYLAATGLICSVGLRTDSACAAMRAGIASYDEMPFWNCSGLPIAGAVVPGLTFDVQFQRRLVEMLAMALQDCLSGLWSVPMHRVPLLVGVAEPGRPGGLDHSAAESIIDDLQNKLGLLFHPSLSRVVRKGHTAGFECLRVVRQIIKAEDVPGCVVCGVDSYNNASSLYWLDRRWRLKRESNMNGLIPGEAAAAVYVQQQPTSPKCSRVTVVGLGFASETASILTEEPLQGRGLADAARQALGEAGWGFHELDFRLSDVTGEEYGFRELTLAEGRLARVVRMQPQPLWHAADSIGDTGAAAGVVQLIQAKAAWTKKYAPGARAGCFTSAVQGDRAVALIQSAA